MPRMRRQGGMRPGGMALTVFSLVMYVFGEGILHILKASTAAV